MIVSGRKGEELEMFLRLCLCDEVESYCVCGWFFDEYNLVLGFGK